MERISPQLKDKVLNYLCDECPLEQQVSDNTKNTLKELEISFDEFNAIMNQFQRYGILEDLNLRHNHCSFVLLTEAHDYVRQGGFTIQEEVFKGNIEKLMLEVENLKKEIAPDHLESINKISGIASAILSGLSIFKS